MLRSLLNQIFDRDAMVRPQVREDYTQRCRRFGDDARQWEWPRRLLEDLLVDAILTSASLKPVTLFVDALDEAGAEYAQQLVTYLHRLNDLAEKKMVTLKICISCRHYPIISHRATEITVQDHNHEDIAAYIKVNLLADRMIGEAPDLGVWQNLVDSLIWQANGVFQWAYIIMPLIHQKVREGESPEDIWGWLPQVPAGLEDVYTYVLNHVIVHWNRKQSFLFFQWVSLAERPLTVSEMRYAITVNDADITLSPKQWPKIKGFVETDERMKERMKALSGGLTELVSNQDGDETIQVVHQSVNDFLRAKGLAFLSELISGIRPSIDGEKIIFKSQATLYLSCLIYLATAEVSREILLNPGDKKKKEGLVKAGPLLSYATINLFVHAEKAGSSRADVVQNEIPVLKRWIGRWVQVYQGLDPWSTTCPAAGTTLIHAAAASNLVDLIEHLGSNNTNIDEPDEDGKTALHLAAGRGHVAMAKLLRAKGADCEARCKYQNTPLVEAASHGHVKFVKWLLHNGANINMVTGYAGGALQTASLAGQESVVQMLLDAHADINAQGGGYGNALQAAACCGNVVVVQMLLDAHAHVNTQGGRYGNALQAAAYNGNVEVVQMLLDAHADINAQGGED